MAVEDHAIAQCFSHYYDNLWHGAQPLDRYLAEVGPERFAAAEDVEHGSVRETDSCSTGT